MPFRNFHSFRVKNPGAFKGTLATRTVAPGITILHGLLKNPPKKGSGKGKLTGRVVQAYRFRSSKFSFSEAGKWMKSHKVSYILSEKASPKVLTNNTNESIVPLVSLEELAGELREKLEARWVNTQSN